MTDPSYIKARNYVLYLLSRREYSITEIATKLKQKKYLPEIIEPLLEEIKTKNWQSDSRCAHMLLRHGAHSGYGPIKIKFQMQQKGISPEIMESLFADLNDGQIEDMQDEYFWHKLAQKAFLKKAGANYDKNDFKTRAKLKQFLYNRGFELEHISYATSGSPSEQEEDLVTL